MKIAFKITQYLFYIRSRYLATNWTRITYGTFRSEIITLSFITLIAIRTYVKNYVLYILTFSGSDVSPDNSAVLCTAT